MTPSQTRALTSKDFSNCSGPELVDNAFHAGPTAKGEKEEADENNDGIEDAQRVPFEAVVMDERKTSIGLAHPKVSDTPEDEAKEAVEERRHQG